MARKYPKDNDRVSKEENVASAHVLEKIGMRQEGHLRQNEWMKGRWWDTLLYAILEHEWQIHP